MAQAKLSSEKAGPLKEKEIQVEEGPKTIPECAVCLQPCIHPAILPCKHIYCYLCVKGVANQSKRCPMCRQEIPPDFLEKPQLVEIDEMQKESEYSEEEYQWFYEGRNGWWQYDQRTSFELETAYKQGKRTCELLIAGFLYIADFGSMLQLRRNDPSRRRRIKRDLFTAPKKGVAGLRLNNQDEEIIREIRGAERSNSPVNDGTNIRDEASTPIPPSNTPQTPAGGAASGDTTPLSNTVEQRPDSLHEVLEQQMRSLIMREHLSFNADEELNEDTPNETLSAVHPSISWIQTSNTSYSACDDDF
ncbi:E3 ubiquitin-protein ligase RNF146 [Prorops nasuta]|uniref:E3 ubiquitin-protein ligase RNF146 n=1 Tax=Prorops nasuta TaxID=863751 RepID=UPI0034CF5590